jgi:hypothetical protein
MAYIDNPDTQRIFKLLSQINSPHMEQVSLVLAMYVIDDLDHVNWSSIEDLLTGPKWASLQRLVLGLYSTHMYAPMPPEVGENVKHRLPKLEMRGAIQISTDDDVPWGA